MEALFPAPDPTVKRCSRCHEFKPLDAFNRRRKAKDGRQPMCRGCHQRYHYLNWERHIAQIRARNDRMVEENSQKLLEYLLEHRCVDCGEPDPLVLEFDHLRDKRKDVSRLMKFSWATIEAEIAKCEVVCANCHRRRTARRARTFRWRATRELA